MTSQSAVALVGSFRPPSFISPLFFSRDHSFLSTLQGQATQAFCMVNIASVPSLGLRVAPTCVWTGCIPAPPALPAG